MVNILGSQEIRMKVSFKTTKNMVKVNTLTLMVIFMTVIGKMIIKMALEFFDNLFVYLGIWGILSKVKRMAMDFKNYLALTTTSMSMVTFRNILF